MFYPPFCSSSLFFLYSLLSPWTCIVSIRVRGCAAICLGLLVFVIVMLASIKACSKQNTGWEIFVWFVWCFAQPKWWILGFECDFTCFFPLCCALQKIRPCKTWRLDNFMVIFLLWKKYVWSFDYLKCWTVSVFFVEETEGLENIAAERVTTDVMVGRWMWDYNLGGHNFVTSNTFCYIREFFQSCCTQKTPPTSTLKRA